MKAFTLISTFLAVASAAPSPQEAIGELIDTTERAITETSDVRSNENGVKILPRMAEIRPKDGAKRTTVKYGSYMVSSSKMLSTTKLAKGPCGGTCYVTAMEATIRYSNGAEANVDTGSWLHHIALFGSGAGAGSIWASGNERPTLRLNEKRKFGLDFPSQFMLIVDLMVEDAKAKNLTLEITYEHVPKTGYGYAAARMYWLTIGEPAAKEGVYSFTTRSMSAKSAGHLLYSIGHMHDGGTDMQLFVGNKMVCKSIMHYDTRAGYAKAANGGMEGMSHGAADNMAGMSHGHKKRSLSRRDGGGHGGHGGSHISDPGACTDFGSVRAGESLKAVANYDAVKHGLMEMNGKKEKLMGNMRVYVGPGIA